MRHFLHVPYPPQVESIAIPFQDAASNALTPVGTVKPFSFATEPSFSSTRKVSLMRPVPSCAGISDGSRAFLLMIYPSAFAASCARNRVIQFPPH